MHIEICISLCAHLSPINFYRNCFVMEKYPQRYFSITGKGSAEFAEPFPVYKKLVGEANLVLRRHIFFGVCTCFLLYLCGILKLYINFQNIAASDDRKGDGVTDLVTLDRLEQGR